MLLQRSQRVLETIPVGSLGLIPLKSCEELGRQVNDYLVKWRHSSDLEHKSSIAFTGYERDSYLIPATHPGSVPEKEKVLLTIPSAETICI